jgi:hypothetical protein
MLTFDRKGMARDQLAFADSIETVFPHYAALIREEFYKQSRQRTDERTTCSPDNSPQSTKLRPQ